MKKQLLVLLLWVLGTCAVAGNNDANKINGTYSSLNAYKYDFFTNEWKAVDTCHHEISINTELQTVSMNGVVYAITKLKMKLNKKQNSTDYHIVLTDPNGERVTARMVFFNKNQHGYVHHAQFYWSNAFSEVSFDLKH